MFKTAVDVASLLAAKCLTNSDTNSSGNYNIRGHINHCPVDLQVDNARRPQSSNTGSNQRVHHTNDVLRSSPATASYNNCQSNSTKNASKNKQQSNFSKKPNVNNGKMCQVIVPDQGNYEIIIKKTESSSTVNLATPGSTRNSQKQKQPNSNQQQKQNGNNKQQNFNQQNNGNNKQQNGNYKQQQAGNQRQQNDSNKQQTGNPKQQTGNRKQQSGNPKLQIAISKQQTGNCKQQNGNPKQNFNGNNKPQNNTAKMLCQNICNMKPSGANWQRSIPSDGINTWMYLGRLKIGTNEFDLQIYLSTKFPGYDFIVESLPLYKDAKLPCFKVRVDNRILEEFQNTTNWPNGVTITKYIENFRS